MGELHSYMNQGPGRPMLFRPLKFEDSLTFCWRIEHSAVLLDSSVLERYLTSA
jgi:hypothetical protein